MSDGRGGVADISTRISNVIEDLGQSSPRHREQAEMLVRLLAELYGDGLQRITAILATEDGGEQRLVRLTGDEVIAGLLVMHGLHPVDLETRVSDALESVRPYLGSHAGGVTLVGIQDDVVHLRLEGSCDGCPASTITVKTAIEGAITKACPEIDSVEVEGVTAAAVQAPEEPAPPPGLHSIKSLSASKRSAPAITPQDMAWTEFDDLDISVPGTLVTRKVDGAQVLLCHLSDDVNAYRDVCPACGSSLAQGTLEDEVLSCPSCASRFDVRRAGRGLDDDGHNLVPLPLLRSEQGRVRIAVPAGVM
ncbi:MAG: NifU family protein [Euzebya sp.]